MGDERHTRKDEAFDVVFGVLSEMMCTPKHKLCCQLQVSDRLVKDLRIDSDDLSFILIPKLEEWVGREIPQADWDRVWSIQDAIDLVAGLKCKG